MTFVAAARSVRDDARHYRGAFGDDTVGRNIFIINRVTAARAPRDGVAGDLSGDDLNNPAASDGATQAGCARGAAAC